MSEAPSSPPPLVLTFAATDPTSGAGLQADLLALASMGCHPLSVVTAITVQDTAGVESFLPLDPDWVADQARCILEDMPVAAFKMGMLGSTDIVTVVAEVVSDYPDVPLVVDPVFASGRGDEFANDEMVSAIRELLVPQSTVVTPNIAELRRLAQAEEDEDAGLAEYAQRLLDTGCEYVLVTGTHDSTIEVINTLYHRGGVLRADNWQRLPGSYHGSGCTLAAALAANLARGLDIGDAVYEAQDYTWHALKNAFRPGMGQYLPDRLFWAREEDDQAEDGK
jgi:hydroxymethylpyrimidine/phosphomethylpyrimidine kinase